MGPSIDQQAAGVGTEGAPLMPGMMGGLEKISPIVEYLLQMLSHGQQPKPSTTSQQVSPYMGPRATPPLRQNMMGGQGPTSTY